MIRRRSAGGRDAVAAVAGVGVVAVVAGLVILLSGRTQPVLGDNGRAARLAVVDLPPGETVCQIETGVTRGADALGIVVAPPMHGPIGPLRAEVDAARAPVGSTGGTADPGAVLNAGGSEVLQPTPTFGGAGSAPARPVVLAHGLVPAGGAVAAGDSASVVLSLDRQLPGAPVDICLQNQGATTLAVLGDPVAPPAGLMHGVKAHGLLSFAYRRARPVSRWSRLGTIATRFSLVKAPWLGSWTMWATLGAVALIWAATVRALRRTLRG